MNIFGKIKNLFIGILAFQLAFAPACAPALASVSVTVNGTTYTIPQTNEKGWGTNVTNWIQGISAGTLQPTGGNFTLGADVNFGNSFGLISPYYKSASSNIAGSGAIRLANTDAIGFRNAANNADLALGVDTSNRLTFAGNPIVPPSSLTASRAVQTDASGVLQASSVTSTELGYVSGVTSSLCGINQACTITNKTLTSPIISSISNSGTLTLPTSSDTLVGRATVDTLTNKTLTGNIAASLVSGAGTSTLPTSTGNIVSITPNQFGLITSGTGTGLGSVIAPDASTSKTLISGGSSAVPSWGILGLGGGGLGISSGTSGGIPYFSGSSTVASSSALTASQVVIGGGAGVAPSTLAAGTANQILKISNGIPTWATPSAGGVNYLSANPDAEANSTTGWATYADAAGNQPVDGTGGSPSSTWSASSSTPLRGTYSFLWTKAGGANRQGEGVSYDFTIDSADQAKPLAITADYTITSGTFTAADGTTAPKNDGTTSTGTGNSDLEFFIYDKTNSVLIPVTPQVLTGNGSSKYSFKGVFQTASNSTSYRLIIHTTTTTTNNFTVEFDNFFVGPQSVSYGSPASDWTSFTMTIAGSSSNPTKASSPAVDQAYWRRIGDSMEIVYSYKQTSSTGAANGSGTYIFKLPTGYSIDTTKLSADTTGHYGIVGPAAVYDGTNNLEAHAGVYDSTGLYIYGIYGTTVTGLALLGPIFPLAGSSTLNYSFTARVPISGWSSTVQMSNDTDTRVVALRVTNATATITGTDSLVTYSTVDVDSHGAYSSGTYTIPVSGIYDITAQLRLSGTFVESNENHVNIYKNGSLDTDYFDRTSGANLDLRVHGLLKCVAGDTIQIKSNSGGTGVTVSSDTTNNKLMIKRLSGPSAIASTESVNGRYFNTASSLTGSFATITMTTKDFDSHNAYSGGTLTIPTSGKYQINTAIIANATLTVNQSVDLAIYKNGSEVSRTTTIAGGSMSNISSMLSDIINCVAGDTITIKAQSNGSGLSFLSSNSRNFLSWSRVGN